MSPTFAQLGVPEPIVKALARRGITQPFEIQTATVADAMAGRDVCGRAPTGSGKTLAFGIPLVAKVGRAQPGRPRALVLAPTRELAQQITTEMRTFAGKVKIDVVYGGVGYGPQLSALRQGVDILVACPGRLEDLIQQRAVKLGDVGCVVLDEADRMADMGFMPSVRRLLDQTSRDRQTMLFSATLDGDVAALTRDYQRSPVRHEVGEDTPDITAATHLFWSVAKADRPEVTAEAINAAWPAMVFCRTRHGADRLAKQLGNVGILAATIHGGRSQNQRTRALADFANVRVHALVASEVAARGIHVDDVASVIHFDVPEDAKAYVHRSGRTARAGQGGVVVTLVQPEQVKDVRQIQRQVGLSAAITAPDAGVLRSLSPAPVRRIAPAEPAAQAEQANAGARKAPGANGSQGGRNGGANPNARRAQTRFRSRRSAGPAGRGNGSGAPGAPKRDARWTP